jgi:septal ring factor EnvC (AmiA/AmiB activator)
MFQMVLVSVLDTPERRLYRAAMLDVPKPIGLESLKLLEDRVHQFVDQHERVRQEYDDVVRRLEQQEKQLAEMAGQLARYEQERCEVRARLERILSRLDGLDLT